MPKNICDIPGCGEEISDETGKHGGLPICGKCRGSQYYWRRKGNQEIAARRERLKFLEERIDYLSPHIAEMIEDAKKKVAKVRKKVRAEARAVH